MTDRFVSVGDDLTLPSAVKVPAARIPDLTESLSSTFGDTVVVRPRRSFETDDTAAIDDALAALANGGVLTVTPGRTLSTAGGHVVPWGVLIDLSNNVVIHTGDGICFDLNHPGDFNNVRPSGVVSGRLVGNSGVNAVGLELGNSWGTWLRDLQIAGYTNGVGVAIANRTNWCEGTNIQNVRISQSKIGLQFVCHGGEYSFGYTRIHSLAVNVPAGGVGIDIGTTGNGNVYLYHTEIVATIWMEGDDAVAVVVGASSTVDTSRVFIVGEKPGSAPYTGMIGLKNLGGIFRVYGFFRIYGIDNSLSDGITRVLPSYGTIDARGDSQYRIALTPNPDLAHVAGYGWHGTDIPVISSYNQSDALRLVGVPYGGGPETGTVILKVTKFGAIQVGGLGDGVAPIIQAGEGAPEWAIDAPPGSIYLRTSAANPAGATLFLKETGSGNTGWISAATVRSGSTANRPTVGVMGFEYFDTTLGKPIWWNGTGWVDAAGTAV